MSLPLPLKGTSRHDKDVQFTEQMNDAASTARPGPKSDQDTLSVSFSGAIRAPSPDPSIISIDDLNNVRFGRNPDYVPDSRHASLSPAARPRSFKGRLASFWEANRGLALVMISQVFGTLMNVTTRLLEMEGNYGELVIYQMGLIIIAHYCRKGLPSISGTITPPL
jgi:hypothetical protein